MTTIDHPNIITGSLATFDQAIALAASIFGPFETSAALSFREGEGTHCVAEVDCESESLDEFYTLKITAGIDSDNWGSLTVTDGDARLFNVLFNLPECETDAVDSKRIKWDADKRDFIEEE